MSALPYFVVIILSGLISAVMIRVLVKLLKKKLFAIPIWIIVFFTIVQPLLKFSLSLWTCGVNGLGCAFLAVGAVLIMLVLSAVSYLIGGVLALLIKRNGVRGI